MCMNFFAFSDSSEHEDAHLGIHYDLTTSLRNVDQKIAIESL